MKILMLAVTLMTLTLFAFGQSNVDMSVFGMKLGEKFSAPECEYTAKKTPISIALNNNALDMGFYSAPKTGVCFARVFDVEKVKESVLAGKPMPSAPNMGKVLIRFAYGESPVILDNPKISYEKADVYAEIVNGYLEEIRFATYGIANEGVVLNALKGKYGNPTDITIEKVQNGYGATYEAYTAVWLLPGLVTTFSNILRTSDTGFVSIKTDKRFKDIEQKNKRLMQNRRAL